MKRFIIIVIVLAIIGAGIYWFLNKGNHQNTFQNRETKSSVSTEKSKPSSKADVGTGQGSLSEYRDITTQTGEGYSSSQAQTMVGTGN